MPRACRRSNPRQASPAAAALPQPRTGGAAAQLGTNLMYIGGSDGSAASATTFVTKVDKGNFGPWAEGPRSCPRPGPRAGRWHPETARRPDRRAGPDGAPTKPVWSMGRSATRARSAPGRLIPSRGPADPAGGPGRRAAVAVADGIVVLGGIGPDKAPTATVWKSTIDANGRLGAFKPQPACRTRSPMPRLRSKVRSSGSTAAPTPRAQRPRCSGPTTARSPPPPAAPRRAVPRRAVRRLALRPLLPRRPAAQRRAPAPAVPPKAQLASSGPTRPACGATDRRRRVRREWRDLPRWRVWTGTSPKREL